MTMKKTDNSAAEGGRERGEERVGSVRHAAARIVRFISVDVWEVSRERATAPYFLLCDILRKTLLTARFFTTKRVMSSASALTYSTLLAIVPILAVVFAIARGFGYNKYIEEWFRGALESQPEVADVIIGFVNSYLVHTQSGVFIGVGLLFMLYTVLMLVSNIEITFNQIWQVKKSRSLYRTFTDYLAMLLLFPILIVVSSGVSLYVTAIVRRMPDMPIVSTGTGALLSLVPYVMMSLVFMGLYMFMPNTHVKLKAVVVPGILAGVAMRWLQIFYIYAQVWMSSYNAIYGSFAALPLFMLFLQISWTIILFGATLCYANQNAAYYDYDTATDDVCHRYALLLSLIIAARICAGHDKGRQPYTATELRDETGIPIRIVTDLLYKLTAAGVLVEMTSDEKDEAAAYMPAESVGHLSAGDLVDRLEAKGKWKIDLDLKQIDSPLWRRLIAIRSAALGDARNVLLKDL